MKNPYVPQASPTFVFWKANNTHQQELRAALSKLGLTYTEYALLAVLVYDSQWRIWNQIRLAQAAGLDKMVVSQTAAALHGKQLIVRWPSATDKREMILSVSGKGRLAAQKAMKIIKAADKRLAAEFHLSQ